MNDAEKALVELDNLARVVSNSRMAQGHRKEARHALMRLRKAVKGLAAQVATDDTHAVELAGKDSWLRS